ncbi:MAG: hypothetical protein AAF798_17135, partial [Bacteroidota bacterium]
AKFGGPPPYSKQPDWKEILSTDFQHAKGIHFGTIIFNTLAEKSVSEEQQGIREVALLKTIYTTFSNNYTTLHPGNLEDMIDWIGSSIIDLEKEIDAQIQTDLLNKLNRVVFQAGESAISSDPSWQQFNSSPEFKIDTSKINTTDFNPCAGTNGKGIWPEYFCLVVWEELSQFIEREIKVYEDTIQILKRLSSTLKGYDPDAEESVRNWVQNTINDLPSTWVSNFQKEELVTNLEFAITDIFPQPDESFFYNNFGIELYRNIYNPPKVDPETERLLKDIQQQQQMIQDAKDQVQREEEALGFGTGTGFDTGTGTGTGEDPMPIATKLQQPGIKQILDSFFQSYDIYVTPKQVKGLEKQISDTIKAGIKSTFDNLVDMGTQGQLLSATYDRQLISRISDYTTNLLNKLSIDLDKDIPTNGSKSLAAAQEITATSVSFRNYAEALLSIKDQFEGEMDRQTGGGMNYHAVSQQINGPNPNNPSLATIEDLAEAVFLGSGSPQPMVKQAEYFGVQLAAVTAGLQTSLQKLLLSDQSAAIKALANLKQNAENNFQEKYTMYNSDATNYFNDLDDYIEARQQYAFDMNNRDIIQQSLDKLATMIAIGEINYDSDAVSTN